MFIIKALKRVSGYRKPCYQFYMSVVKKELREPNREQGHLGQ